MKWLKMVPVVVSLSALAASTNAHAQDIRLGVQNQPVLDPHYQYTDQNVAFLRHVYSSLTTITPDGSPKPDIAVSWETKSPTEWVFHLREGVRFTDGSELNAADVVASFNRVNTVPATASFVGAVRNLKEVREIDSHTVLIELNAPNPLIIPQLSNIFILPEELVGAGSGEFTDGKAAIGSGPYEVVRYVNGDQLVLKANSDYFGNKANWENVEFRVIPDGGARVAALLGGDVDFIDFVPPNLADRIRENEGTHIISGASHRTVFLHPDTERDQTPFAKDKNGNVLPKNPLKDSRVREAISLAIDRKAIIDRVLYGLGVPTGQVTREGYGGYDPDIAVPQVDLDRAKALLAEAGYPEGFQLTNSCPSDRWIETSKVCQAIGQMLSRLGLTMNVEILPASVYYPRAMDRSGERYSLPMMGFTDPWGEADETLSLVLHSPTGGDLGSWNWGGYSNPAVDKLIERGLSTEESSERHAIFKEALSIILKENAVIPLYQLSIAVGAKSDLDYTIWPSEFTIADSIVRKSE